MLKRDVQATAKRNFLDKRSYVCPDGREVLYRLDWKSRVQELRIRCGGRCEVITADGSRCRSEAADPHHIRPRWPKRDDRLTNLQAVCRLHHSIFDPRKIGGRR